MTEHTTTAEIMEASAMPVARRVEPLAPAEPASLNPLMLLDRAMERGADMEVLERLMDLQERHEAKEARRAFDRAIADAKAELPAITKDRVVDFTGNTGIRTHYRHESLAGIERAISPILGAHGLSYRFRAAQGEGGRITVTCIVAHRDGHSEETSLAASPDGSGNKNNHQAIASATTYLQRYTLKLALGLAAGEDDDGREPTPNREEEEEVAEVQLPKAKPTFSTGVQDAWEASVLDSIPEDADARTKAEAFAEAICADFARKGPRSLDKAWDRHGKFIRGFKERHTDLHEKVTDAFLERQNELAERGAGKPADPIEDDPEASAYQGAG